VECKRRLIELWNLFEIVQSRIEVLEIQDPVVMDMDELAAQRHRAHFEDIYSELISFCDSFLEYFDQ